MKRGRRPPGAIAGVGLLACAAVIAAIGGRLKSDAGPTLTRYAVIAAVLGSVLLMVAYLNRRPVKHSSYFYVSAIQDGRAVFVTGPYASRDLAASDIAQVRDALAGRGSLDRAYSWGVSESPDRFDGLANAEVGFQPAA